MEDEQIIELYFHRDEAALTETANKYGTFCLRIAMNVLSVKEDAEECVSSTYMKTWVTIPPQRPGFFYAYIAKICRHLALDRLDWKSAVKRKAEVVSLTQEMEQCIPDRSHDRKLEGEEIGQVLNRFLDSISLESRLIFMRRYWYTDSIQEIAARYNISQSKVKTQLHRTRNKLQLFLESEGIYV